MVPDTRRSSLDDCAFPVVGRIFVFGICKLKNKNLKTEKPIIFFFVKRPRFLPALIVFDAGGLRAVAA